jgi:hypothetical protein
VCWKFAALAWVASSTRKTRTIHLHFGAGTEKTNPIQYSSVLVSIASNSLAVMQSGAQVSHMNWITGMLLYLLAARLAIVSAGIVSMVLGYRLLCRGVGMADQKNQGSTIDSSLAGLKFRLKMRLPAL